METIPLPEFVSSYILDRRGLLQEPKSFETLGDFGQSPETLSALEHGARFLQENLRGKNLIFYAKPDQQQNLLVQFRSSSLRLDGRDARCMESNTIEKGMGIVSRSLARGTHDLVTSEVRADRDYLEFSRETNAVYSIPIKGLDGALGVFCIDSSHGSNFQSERRLRWIHNFAELLLIADRNREIQRLQVAIREGAEVVALEGERRLQRGLAETWPMGPTLLRILKDGPQTAVELAKVAAMEEVCLAMSRLGAAELVTVTRGQFVLTKRGHEVASRLRELFENSGV